jgi:hypothetical protein
MTRVSKGEGGHPLALNNSTPGPPLAPKASRERCDSSVVIGYFLIIDILCIDVTSYVQKVLVFSIYAQQKLRDM